MDSKDLRKHILFVDDEMVVRQSYQDILELSGYHADIASDGAEGIRKIKENAGQYDVIITDLVMQHASGMELLEQARTCDPDAMVILITGFATVESAIDAIRKGAYDYLVKPFATANLLLTIERAIEKRQLLIENRQLITDLKNNNRQLQTTLQQLRDTQKLLLQNERKDAFIQTVITVKHEISNPLTALVAKLHVLSEKCSKTDPVTFSESLKITLELANRISEVMRQLDTIEHPVCKKYIGDMMMIDISKSSG